jgi:hypothetical protein
MRNQHSADEDDALGPGWFDHPPTKADLAGENDG